MRAFLAAVAMFQALITGDCLLCEQCFTTGTAQCSGIFKQCSPDVTHCVKGIENSTLGSEVTLTAFKDCLDPSHKATCGRKSSLKTSVLSLIISRTCCDSDFCNGGDIQVPAVDEIPNGYKCEDCFTSQSADTCTEAAEVQCTGEHNTCLSFTGTGSRPGEGVYHYTVKGCVTQDYCQLFYLVGTQTYTYDLQCSPAKKL
uniref:Sodefrin-like factor 4 n=1 Tax=Lissotriton helveticus TaxID=256425 RepID=A0A0B5GR32_9SALA|nr:sodefrin precursor-like factor 4 [Lissotriton helveticus]